VGVSRGLGPGTDSDHRKELSLGAGPHSTDKF
jgi:hypothetical protein